MWTLLAPLIDEVASAAIARLFLWRKSGWSIRGLPRAGGLPAFLGDLERFYEAPGGPAKWQWPRTATGLGSGVRFADFRFPSAIASGFAKNDAVHVRRWWGSETGSSVVGLGGLVQFGYFWFDRLAAALAARGVELWMMDEPFNHRRTPPGFLPGELIAGAGPEQLLFAVRQAVIDARALIAGLRARGHRVGVVGQSYGGWLSLLLALLEPDLEFVVALAPVADVPAWYRAGLPLPRGARQRFPHYSNDQLTELLRPVNPIAWRPLLSGDRIDVHGARHDRLVVYESIEQLARAWGTRFTSHPEGHYSMFFGERLRDQVLRIVASHSADYRHESVPVGTTGRTR